MGYTSIFGREYVEASDEAQTLAFEERDEDSVTVILHVEFDKEDDEDGELQVHGGIKFCPRGCGLVERRKTSCQRERAQTSKVEFMRDRCL